jgi:translation elongation factor EF-Ts
LLDAAARAEVAQLANGMAMHVVANRPSFVSATHIPASVQEAQQGVFMAQVRHAAR